MKAERAMWISCGCTWRWALLIALTSVTGACVIWLFTNRVCMSDPISTMRTFRDAIEARRWRIASKCLSDEIQHNNADFLYKPTLYTTSYWQLSRGMESFLNNQPPLIEKDCDFRILSQGERQV